MARRTPSTRALSGSRSERREEARTAARSPTILVLGLDSDGNRTVLNPSALRDDDNDNFLDACFGDEVDGLTLIRVSVNSHVFYSPMNAPNRAAAVEIGSP